MKAIILAAGRGSRMASGTADKPKCLMKLWGKTLLAHSLDALQEVGFTLADISIVTGYRNKMIQVPGMRYFHNTDWENTNMFVSLCQAAEWLRSETCIVTYSDIVYSPNAIKALMSADSALAITYYTGFWELWQRRFINPLDDLETFKQNDGKLVEIGNKPINQDDVQGQYMGLLWFTPHGWNK